MFNKLSRLCLLVALVFACSFDLVRAAEVPNQKEVKEWTFLNYINGKNSLDEFATKNILQMEKVGSTSDINVVVEWGSLERRTVQRFLVLQSTDPTKVTSPVLEDMGAVDMGNWNTLVEFIRWGVAQYPAKHYFINVWDHGNGWRLMNNPKRIAAGFHRNDISWDDLTGSFITTEQLGEAMSEAAKVMGHKVDIYGSDACLMAMVEVADEMAEFVNYSVGSEEVEPGDGWPYDLFLDAWSNHSKEGAANVAKMLTKQYIKYYEGLGTKSEVTLSAFDLSGVKALKQAISGLARDLTKINQTDLVLIRTAAQNTQEFYNADFSDLGNFADLVVNSKINSLDKDIATLKAAINGLVIANEFTDFYKKAHGVSIWLPTDKSTYDLYFKKYSELKFQADTNWGDALDVLLK